MKITVNLNELDLLAKDIDYFCESFKNPYGIIQDSMHSLKDAWSGEDQMAFMEKFHELDNDKSQYKSILLASENYAKRLRGAIVNYKNAQFQAVDAARHL